MCVLFFFFQAEDGIRDAQESRGLGDVYKRQELVCALQNYQENNPAKAAMRIRGLFPAPGHYELHLCTQCGECAQVCPTGAIYQREDGAYIIDANECTGCYACVDACPEG